MTTLIGRETPRKRLGVLLKADVDTALSLALEEAVDAFVTPNEPKESGARSPMINIHSEGSALMFAPYVAERHRFWVTWYWRRDDPALTEDRFDLLSLIIHQCLLDHVSEPGYWNDLTFADDFSEAAYAVLDGHQYRTERMRVVIEHICG